VALLGSGHISVRLLLYCNPTVAFPLSSILNPNPRLRVHLRFYCPARGTVRVFCAHTPETLLTFSLMFQLAVAIAVTLEMLLDDTCTSNILIKIKNVLSKQNPNPSMSHISL
jgi:hypothetical protein